MIKQIKIKNKTIMDLTSLKKYLLVFLYLNKKLMFVRILGVV